MKSRQQRAYRIGASVLTAAVLAAGAMSFMPTAPRSVVGAKNTAWDVRDGIEKTVKKSPVDGNYYFADYDSAQDAFEAGDRLNKELLSEGATLLKNENSLPLKAGAKVSVFGRRSGRDLRYGGAGSGAGSGGDKITLAQSLERAGLAVNPTLTSFYNDSARAGAAGGATGTYGIYAGPNNSANGFETPVDMLRSNVNESTYGEYGDAAIVVISRGGNESSDLPKGMSTGYGGDGRLNGAKVNGARSYDDHYLQLDQNEADLIKYVGGLFDNVIVLFNTGSQMEVGFLDDPGHYAYHKNIKGAMWIGFPGNGNGLEAVGEIIAGKISPSGHTVDTYARDFKLDPTWSNMPTYTNNLFNYTDYSARSFVNYKEGVYSGYRYYETRGITEGGGAYVGDIHGTTTTEWNSWYDAHVVYPFGYGLSYTSFEWKLADGGDTEIAADGGIRVSVEVTNTGDVAGKDVVQLYYTAPYTDGGIEKPHVVLGGYAKTKLISPGESDTVTIELAARDMASYDYSDANKNGFRGYELEAGDYTVSISRNAHEHVLQKTYKVSGGYKYAESASGAEVKNRFADAEIENIVYLSRSDFAGTFPTEPTAEERVAPQSLAGKVEETSVNDKIIAADDPTDPYYFAEPPATGADNGIKLESLYGLDKDAAEWDRFLDQLVVGGKSEKGSMVDAVWNSGWKTNGCDRLGIPEIHHEDGPSGIAGKKISGSYTNFASETVTASTWNRELAERKGNIIGNQGLFGNGSKHVEALYAPACNIHRSPFGGRNFEYFSEDPLLSGEMAGNIVKGCNDKGMITFVKHFAVNDQESNRDKLLTWANEQTIREIYLRPFRICVEKYESHGMMSALNSLGAVWTGGHYALLTEVLRGEWGFDGIVITDYVQSRGQLNGNMALRGGGDILLATASSGQTPAGLDKPTTVGNLRRASRNLYYNIVNHTAAFNKSVVNAMGAYDGGTLTPVIDSLEYEQSVATVTLRDGGSGSDIEYSLKDGSELPEGLTLGANGVISGTAEMQSEAAEFTVVARYGFAEREATFTLPIVDRDRSVIYIRQQSSIDGAVGADMNARIDWAYTMDGKKHDITYSLAEGSVMPDGLTLGKDGAIKGKAALPFTDYNVTVRAESEGLLPMSVKLTLNMYGEQRFKPSALRTAKLGEPYAESVAVGSDGSVKYSLRAGDSLPQGLTLTDGGTVVGTPTEAGQKSFTVIATGKYIKTAEQEFTINVGIRYDAFRPADGTVGVKYETYVNFAQGATDVRYSLTDGILPRGLTLTRDGLLTGVPKESGNFEFTVSAKAGGLADSATATLHIDDATSHTAYYVGLGIGIAAIVIAAAGCVVYVLVIDKRNYADGSKAKLNKKFISIASPIVGVMLVCVITLGAVLAPSSDASRLETYTFEAEYVYLDEFMGAGISNSGEGVNNIYGDGGESDIAKGWSNGYFLGNTYAKNSITFEITSDRAADGKLILRLASELGSLSLDNGVFGLEVNGKEVEYSITVANSAAGSYDFADYPISTAIKLGEGVNTVTLTIKDNTLKDGNSIGAPLIDCIRITTDAELTWSPLIDNPDNRGKI